MHGGALEQRVAVLDLAEVAEEVVAPLARRDEPEALLAVPSPHLDRVGFGLGLGVGGRVRVWVRVRVRARARVRVRVTVSLHVRGEPLGLGATQQARLP